MKRGSADSQCLLQNLSIIAKRGCSSSSSAVNLSDAKTTQAHQIIELLMRERSAFGPPWSKDVCLLRGDGHPGAMQNQNTSPELIQLLALEQQHIRERFRYIYYITKRPPNSDASWPSDLFQYDYDELRARICGSDQRSSPNPYAQYDVWIAAHCGPDGHARAGGMVGFRDQSSAKSFLRWIFPTLLDRGTATENDMKLHLARMMVRTVPNNETADELFLRIGDDIIAKIDAGQLAFLADQMFIMKEQGDHNDELASESEMLAVRIMDMTSDMSSCSQTEQS